MLADFAGLYKRENNKDPNSARSRTGYIIAFSGVPLYWKSVLQREVCQSTAESECVALGHAMKALIPLIELLKEFCAEVVIDAKTSATLHADVFEDNSAASNEGNL